MSEERASAVSGGRVRTGQSARMCCSIVGERFRVFEDPRELDVVEQLAQVMCRVIKDRLGEVRGGSGGCGGCLGTPGRHEESCGDPNKPPPTSPTSPNLPQPRLSHLNTIHSTPIVAARTIERTMFRFRGPAGTGIAVISGAP